MSDKSRNLDIIGRAEQVDFPGLKLTRIPAKIDTGADSSTIWASQVIEKTDGLYCVFFGPDSPFYTGQTIKITNNYTLIRVENSFGQKQLRYKLKLRVKVQGRLIRATFTLSDRSSKTYPVLLGRRLLRGKFLVDVTRGETLQAAEAAKSRRLQADSNELKQSTITT